MITLDISSFTCRSFVFDKNGTKKTGYQFWHKEVVGYKVITHSIVFFEQPTEKIFNVSIKEVFISSDHPDFIRIEYRSVRSNTTKE